MANLAQLFASQANTESGNNDYTPSGSPVISPKGAMYAMQVMPNTAANPGFGVTPAQNNTPAEYDRVGQDYIQALTNHYGDLPTALAAYNWGPGNVDKYGVQNAPPETQGYVQKVLSGIGNSIIPPAEAAQPSAPLPPGFVLDAQSNQGPTVNQSANQNLPDGFVLDKPNVATDVAKSFGTGLGKGAVQTLTGPMDIGGLISSKLIGNSTLGVQPGGMIDKMLGYVPSVPQSWFTNAATNALGLDYKPQTIAGDYADTAGSFLPAVAALTRGNGQPASQLAQRILGNTALTAGASETAGQLTKGTDLEPYARLGAAVLGPAALEKAGGLLASGASDINAGRNALSGDDLSRFVDSSKSQSSPLYTAMRQSGDTLTEDATSKLMNNVTDALNSSQNKYIPELNPKTVSIIKAMQSDAENGTLGVSDVDQYRRLLSRVGGSEDGYSANVAKTAIDKTMDSLGGSDLSNGNTNSIALLNQARATAARGFRTEAVADIINKANGDPYRLQSALQRYVSEPDNLIGSNVAEKTALQGAANATNVDNFIKGLGKFGISFSKTGTGNTVLPILMGLGKVGGSALVPGGIPAVMAATAARYGQKLAIQGRAQKALYMIANRPIGNK